NTESSLIDWEEREVKEDEKFLKKNFIFFLPFRNKFSTFAPALRDKRNKKEIHVRRHIELTAVLTEMLKQKNKSNRIERFEKNR
ncbi:hypothetical protein, partial [Flavobacterium hercynium]|uniref:hypothetical protein n=2 Tax=Flavobacterium hercynium TaxID=387094 RepID=UPI001AD8168C